MKADSSHRKVGIVETDGSGDVLGRYVYGPGDDEPLVWYDGPSTAAGDRRFLAQDERGSVVAVMDGAGGTVAINRYDDWGIPAQGNLGRFQYTGQRWVPELQAYDYKARIYSPLIGRFLQADPIGYGDGLNWYNYVGGDAVDPDGTCASPDPGTIIVCGSLVKPVLVFAAKALGLGSIFHGIGSLFGGGGHGAAKAKAKAEADAKAKAEAEQTQARSNQGLSTSTKLYLCGKLKVASFSIKKAYDTVLAERKAKLLAHGFCHSREKQKTGYMQPVNGEQFRLAGPRESVFILTSMC